MLSVTMDEQPPIFVPDRFDMLQRRAAAQLEHIVVPVDIALNHIKHVSTDMNAAGRGAFLLFRGDSGSGKSTFLNTLGMFLVGVEVLSISRDQPIDSVLRDAHPTNAKLRVLIRQKCSQALHILDRFHIVAKMNKALDEIRAAESRKMAQEGHEPLLKKSRWCVLKRKENLTSQQNIRLRDLRLLRLETAIAREPQTPAVLLTAQRCRESTPRLPPKQ